MRGSPRKVRLVATSVVGLSPQEAIARLSLARQKPAESIIKVIRQGLANAKNNFKVGDIDKLKISQIQVNEGPRAKRMDKSHGARFDRGIIQKKFYHLQVVLELKEKHGKQS